MLFFRLIRPQKDAQQHHVALLPAPGVVPTVVMMRVHGVEDVEWLQLAAYYH